MVFCWWLHMSDPEHWHRRSAGLEWKVQLSCSNYKELLGAMCDSEWAHPVINRNLFSVPPLIFLSFFFFLIIQVPERATNTRRTGFVPQLPQDDIFLVVRDHLQNYELVAMFKITIWPLDNTDLFSCLSRVIRYSSITTSLETHKSYARHLWNNV